MDWMISRRSFGDMALPHVGVRRPASPTARLQRTMARHHRGGLAGPSPLLLSRGRLRGVGRNTRDQLHNQSMFLSGVNIFSLYATAELTAPLS